VRVCVRTSRYGVVSLNPLLSKLWTMPAHIIPPFWQRSIVRAEQLQHRIIVFIYIRLAVPNQLKVQNF